MEAFGNFIGAINGIVWSDPMIVFIVAAGIYFSVRLRFVQVRSFRDQVHQVFRRTSSDEGISTFASFCTTMAARIGTGNIAGVAVAIFYGGPGAVFWMLFMAILGAATSYVECSLAQVYKVTQDKEYRGGVCYYIDKGLGWKGVAIAFAILTIICVPILTVGTHAHTISAAFENALSIPIWVTGLAVALLLAAIIFGGIKRISKTAELMVPFMCLVYLVLTVVIIIANLGQVPHVIGQIIGSAFGADAMFGGLMGYAISWGIKRSVNSSAAGMGENTPAAAAAECDHPAQQGLANAFGVYIDIAVCLCSALIILMTDCFNVLSPDGSALYVGQGSARMAELAASKSVGIHFAQEAIATILPSAGSIIVAICVFFFAFTCVINYYYQGETNIAYLLRNRSEGSRRAAIFALRVVMPLVYLFFSVNSSGIAWSAGEIGVGLMVWFNVIIMIILSNVAVKVYKDYQEQYTSGKKPLFFPNKVGVENADLWETINRGKSN